MARVGTVRGVERTRTRKAPVAQSAWLTRARTRVEVNLFAARTLQARSWWGLIFSIALLVLGAWLAWQDFTRGAWGVSLAAGIIGLGREVWSIVKAGRAPSSVVVRRDVEFARAVARRVTPSAAEVQEGFTVLPVPHLDDQAVVRSASVDRWLRASPLLMEDSTVKRDEVVARLRGHAGQLETLLRCHARESTRAVPPRVLLNEPKLGLSDGISPARATVRVHPVSYFHSLLTNEAATRSLESLDEDPEVVFSGGDLLFPIDRSGDSWSLLPLMQSRMSDHIGVSTLVVTRDRKLVFWNQGDNAQQSRNLFVSTGSGSCDWSDRVDGDLKATIVRSMEREFSEESFGGERPPSFECETRVLGYFRWLLRAGKPEFTGVTYVALDAHQLRPNIVEVNRRRRVELSREVPDLAALRQVLDELLASSHASVSFWMNLLTLREAISDAPDEWSDFLRL